MAASCFEETPEQLLNWRSDVLMGMEYFPTIPPTSQFFKKMNGKLIRLRLFRFGSGAGDMLLQDFQVLSFNLLRIIPKTDLT